MKYDEVTKKIQDRADKLTRPSAVIKPLHLKMSQKVFNKLQEDMVLNHRDLTEDYKLKPTDKPKEYSLAHPHGASSAIISII